MNPADRVPGGVASPAATRAAKAPAGRRPTGRHACATLPAVSDARPQRDGRAAPRDAVDAFSGPELAAATGGSLLRDAHRPIHGAAVDSRLVRPGQVFVALPGARTDGHRYLREAVVAGAAALIVTEEPSPATLQVLGDVTIVLVDDALAALRAAAAAWRARFSPAVVGITGSIAKTSTKEAVAQVLSAQGATLRSEGNQNNEIGLPLTLLRLTRDDRHAVLEMGMYTGGEIADLAALARPSIGIVTAVLGVHLSRIGSIEAVEAAKGELVEALPGDGTAILNADDLRVRRMAARTRASVVTYGFAEDADVRGMAVEGRGLDGMAFRVEVRGPAGRDVAHATIPNLGRLSVHNALAAVATGMTVGMELEAITGALAHGWTAPHRGVVDRVQGVTIVDDAYNASPASMRAALELLLGLPGRHVAVLGAMRELGQDDESGHREVGEAAAATDWLVVVGDDARGIADGALAAGMDPATVTVVPDRAAALDVLVRGLRKGDAVLLKASRGVELDRLADDLRAALA